MAYTHFFYQNYWVHIAPLLISFCKEAFEKQHIPPEVNKIYICLIPKILHPTIITQYKPLQYPLQNNYKDYCTFY